jgi:hypothetical protein
MKLTIKSELPQLLEAVNALNIAAGEAFKAGNEVLSNQLFSVANCLNVSMNQLLRRNKEAYNEEFKLSIPSYRKRLKELQEVNPKTQTTGWSAYHNDRKGLKTPDGE